MPDGRTLSDRRLSKAIARTDKRNTQGEGSPADAQMILRSTWTLERKFLIKSPEHKCKPVKGQKKSQII